MSLVGPLVKTLRSQCTGHGFNPLVRELRYEPIQSLVVYYVVTLSVLQ